MYKRQIEDASQTLGSKLKGKHSGTFSQLGCFSLYAGKVITSGEGGAIVTNNKNLFEKLRQRSGIILGLPEKQI